MAFEYLGGEKGLLFVPVFLLRVANRSKGLLCQGTEEFNRWGVALLLGSALCSLRFSFTQAKLSLRGQVKSRRSQEKFYLGFKEEAP